MGKCLIALPSLIGKEYNYLTIESAWREKRWGALHIMVSCRCTCGGTIVCTYNHLWHGSPTSCGCKIVPPTPPSPYKHGMSHTRLYAIYRGMLTRCTNANYSKYCNYGGRGISICNEWQESFEVFAEWALQNGYADTLTIERVNVNGNYNPLNCTWILPKEQARNRRSSTWLTIGEETLTVSEWSRKSGTPSYTIRRRVKRGYTARNAVYGTK